MTVILQKILGFFIVLEFILPLGSFAQKRIPPEKPKLVIGVIIEQMNNDDFFRYWDKFEDNGFKRIVNEGAICKYTQYDYLITQSLPGTATNTTGCNPSVHGIVADSWPDIAAGKIIPGCGHGNYKATGKYSENYDGSPENMLSTTIGDELILSGNGKSKVLSIAINPDLSVILAGHAANAAYWFDNNTGCWISNNYFVDSLPEWVNIFNDKGLASVYLGKEWKSQMPLPVNKESTDATKKSNSGKTEYFSHILKSSQDKHQSFGILGETPFGDNIVKDFAIDAIVSEEMGKDQYPDVLFITFSSTSRISRKFGVISAELEDSYLRLDKEIAHLLQFLDVNLGKENIVMFLTSCHGSAYDTEVMKKNKIPAGSFDADKAMILLKAYLNALYRPGDWVKKYYNGQIFLNRELIEDSKIRIEDFRRNVAEFMGQFSGVAAAITADYNPDGSKGASDINKVLYSNYPKRCGDIFIVLEPNWMEINSQPELMQTANCPNVPLLWYGWKLNRVTINRRVSVTDIVPTLANFLNIRRPQGCTGVPVTELTE